MAKQFQVDNHFFGEGLPTFIIAEIGINHNGKIDNAKKLIDVAVRAGCNAVKFQKRNPDVCVPEAYRNVLYDTPWGKKMPYIEYRHKIEFGKKEYNQIDSYCHKKDILWFASSWDEDSVDFLENYNPPFHKIPSACLTDDSLLLRIKSTNRPVFLSTGFSTLDQIKHAVLILKQDRLLIGHSTSCYPCMAEEINLLMIKTLSREFDCPIGYSGHEMGLQTTYAAVALGACFIERHITLNRKWPGSDQNFSLEPAQLEQLVHDIRTIEKSMGDGVKKVYDCEKKIMPKLRRF